MISNENFINAYPPIQHLVRPLYEHYQAKNFDQEQFADLATRHLDEFSDYNVINSYDILLWLNNTHFSPKQFSESRRGYFFGEPPVTLFYCDHFILDVYFWVNSNTDIHDHSFSGAFKVIKGATIQNTFKFNALKKYNDGMSLGKMQLSNTMLIDTPNVCIKILPGDQFIHSTIHLTKPTITLCLRTLVDTQHRSQHGYYPTGIRLLGLSSHWLIHDLLKLIKLEGFDLLKGESTQLIRALSPKEKIYCIVHLLNSSLDYAFIYELVDFISDSDSVLAESCKKLVKFYQKNAAFNLDVIPDNVEKRIINMLLNNCTNANEIKNCLRQLSNYNFSEESKVILSKILSLSFS